MQEQKKCETKYETIYILFLITKNNFGGAQKYVYNLAKSISQIKDDNIKYKIKIATGKNTPNQEPLLDIKSKEINIEIIKINSLSNSLNPLKLLKQIIEIRKILKIEKPDIIHINSNMAGIAGSIASLLLPTKTIFTAHGWAFNEDRNIIIKKIIKIISHLTVLFSDITISVSHKTKQDLYKIIHKKVEVIYNGIDYKKSNQKNNFDLFDRSTFSTNKIHLVSIGELHHVKGHDMIIDVIAKIKKENKKNNFVYHIFGEGDFRKSLEQKIIKNNLEQDIFLYGYVKDAYKYLHNFDLFLMPSRSEALCYTLIEAYNSGLPSIHSDVGGMTEITNIYTKFLNNKNTKTISTLPSVENFYKILNNEDLIKNLLAQKTEELSDIPEEFKENTMLYKTLNLYNKILNSKKK